MNLVKRFKSMRVCALLGIASIACLGCGNRTNSNQFVRVLMDAKGNIVKVLNDDDLKNGSLKFFTGSNDKATKKYFSPEEENPINGKIIAGRYYAPENIFSCEADDFGQGKYISQDVVDNSFAVVAFYNSTGDFKKAEILNIPAPSKQGFDLKWHLMRAFDDLGIGVLKKVDNAQGIAILQEEMIEDNALFVAISVEKNSFLKTAEGRYLPATRGYLIFYEKNRLVVLSNQHATISENHMPEKHIENLRRDILNFRKTFEFNSIES